MRDHMQHGLPLSQLALVAGVAGLLGGAAVIAAEGLANAGPLILLPYTLFVLGTAGVLQRRGERRTAVRFTVILAAYMLATLLLAGYIQNFEPTALPTISWWGFIWRLGYMLGIGAVVSGIAALLSIGEAPSPRVSVRSSAPTA